jgi:3-hydroxyacyl-CoA dehydrogenase
MAGEQYEQILNAKRVCVIGAGTMGSGIAAHLANLGFDVTLLDQTKEAAQAAFERATQARPPHFFVPDTAELVRLGGIDEHLGWAAMADWVCEAIIENMDAKRALFEKLDEILPQTTMITTNTSGLEISLLAAGRSESFRRRFMGTHFFNPPRYLKLLELIPTDETASEAVAAMTRFLEEKVGRRVVLAKDTPGFIANRFGMWSMFHAVHSTEKLHLSVEQVDAITGPFLGRPRSASFRLNDIVGLDIMRDIATNLRQRCPNDPHIGVLELPRSVETLLSRGWIGEKAGQGYYRKEGRELMALDLGTLAYRQKQEFRFPSLEALQRQPLGERIAAGLELRDEAGEFLRTHLIPVLKYANYLKEEISHNVLDFDRVMMWGFGWEKGPFAMIDAIGADRLGLEESRFYTGATLRGYDGSSIPMPSEPDYRPLQAYPVVSEHETFVLRDLGDGVMAVALTTKMGTINPTLVRELHDLLDTGKLSRFVLCSEARSFSVGFDLRFFQEKIEVQDWTGIDVALQELQRLTLRLREHASVAALHGYCLGAGLELSLGCSTIVALAETQIGLPESKVGLLPGGAGTVLMRLLAQEGGAKAITDAAIRLTTGQVSVNSVDARKLGYLEATATVVYHPDRLISEAKKVAQQIEPRPLPQWIPPIGPVVGMIDRAQEEMKGRGLMTDYDEVIGDRIKSVFSKSSSTEEALVKEREAFLDLCGRALTHARIRHMLETNKPLRN